MSAVTARLVDDGFSLDDPTDEDGSKPTLALEGDQADEPGPEEQARLEAVLERGRAQIERGEYVLAEDFLRRLRARRQT